MFFKNKFHAPDQMVTWIPRTDYLNFRSPAGPAGLHPMNCINLIGFRLRAPNGHESSIHNSVMPWPKANNITGHRYLLMDFGQRQCVYFRLTIK